MKRLFLIISLLITSHSQAALIQLVPDKDMYTTNDIISVNLVVSEFDSTLGGFFTEIMYKPTEFEFISSEPATGFNSTLITAVDELSGSLFLEEYADFFEEESNLSLWQGQQFNLASFSIKAIKAGEFILGFGADNTGLLTFDNDFLMVNYSPLSLNIDDHHVSVPEPISIFMFASAFLLLIGNRKINRLF